MNHMYQYKHICFPMLLHFFFPSDPAVMNIFAIKGLWNVSEKNPLKYFLLKKINIDVFQ